MSLRRKPKGNAVQIPPDATHWMLWRLANEKRTGSGHHGRRSRCTGEPLSDGSVPDSWPVSEFSTARVLQTFGPGKYQVDFYNTEGERLAGQHFEVADPKSKAAGPRLRRAPPGAEPAAIDPVEAPTGAASNGSMSAWDIMAMMDRRDQAVQQREREMSERAMQRDREFFATMQAQTAQMMGQLMATSRASAPADGDLLRRELALSIREGLATIRRDVSEQLGTMAPEDDDEPEDPPRDINEAGERIGIKLLEEIQARAPNLLDEIIPAVGGWLQTRGFVPSSDLQREIADRERMRAVAGGANGRPRGQG